MKNEKRWMAQVMMVVMATGTMLTGCGNGKSSEADNGATLESEAVLETETETVKSGGNEALDEYLENVRQEMREETEVGKLIQICYDAQQSEEFQNLIGEYAGGGSYTYYDLMGNPVMTVSTYANCDHVEWIVGEAGQGGSEIICNDLRGCYRTRYDFSVTELFYEYVDGTYISQETIEGTVDENGFYTGKINLSSYDSEKGNLSAVYYVDHGKYVNITPAIAETFAQDETSYIYGVKVDNSDSPKAGSKCIGYPVAEMYHNTLCPSVTSYTSNESVSTMTRMAYADENNMNKFTVAFTTDYEDVMYVSVDGMDGLFDKSSTWDRSMGFYPEDDSYGLEAWTYGKIFADDGASLSTLSKETLIGWMTTMNYTEGDYYELDTITPENPSYDIHLYEGVDTTISMPTFERLIFKVTGTKGEEQTPVEGYVIYIDDLNTGMRQQYAYYEQSQIYDDARALHIAQSIEMLNY